MRIFINSLCNSNRSMIVSLFNSRQVIVTLFQLATKVEEIQIILYACSLLCTFMAADYCLITTLQALLKARLTTR